MATRLRVFISYSWVDREVADDISRALSGLPLDLWIDHKRVAPGDSFVSALNDALEDATYVIVLLSHSALKSQWVSREWMAAMASKSIIVLPVRVDSCDLPALLRDILHVDLSSDRAAGLAQLTEFFRRELAVPSAGSSEEEARRSDTSEAHPLRHASRRTLRLVAQHCMRESHLKSFLFDEDRDPGELCGSSLNERIADLLIRVANDGELVRFADWLESEAALRRCVANGLQRFRS